MLSTKAKETSLLKTREDRAVSEKSSTAPPSRELGQEVNPVRLHLYSVLGSFYSVLQLCYHTLK